MLYLSQRLDAILLIIVKLVIYCKFCFLFTAKQSLKEVNFILIKRTLVIQYLRPFWDMQIAVLVTVEISDLRFYNNRINRIEEETSWGWAVPSSGLARLSYVELQVNWGFKLPKLVSLMIKFIKIEAVFPVFEVFFKILRSFSIYSIWGRFPFTTI